MQPALRPLALVLKAFLKQRGLNEAATGGLSSYSLCNMVLAHIQEELKVCGKVWKGVGRFGKRCIRHRGPDGTGVEGSAATDCATWCTHIFQTGSRRGGGVGKVRKAWVMSHFICDASQA